MSDVPQMVPQNDHEWILALSGSITNLAQNVSRFVDVQSEMNKRLEEHVSAPGHLLTAELLKQHDTRLTGLEKSTVEIKTTVDTHSRRWGVVMKAGAIIFSLATGGFGLGIIKMLTGM